jgi:hypothetical protein
MNRNGGTLKQVAAQCLREAEGDWVAAATEMRAIVDADPDFRGELLKPLISGAIWDLIRYCASQDRLKCIRPEAGTDSTTGLEEMARRTLLDFPLRGGQRLGDAKRLQVVESADWYNVLACANGTNAAWLKSVIKALPDDDKTVSDVLSEEEVRTLRTKAEKKFT